MTTMRTLLLAVVLGAASCATVPPIPTSLYGEACANLNALGCPEGAKANCAAVMQTAQEAHLTDLRPSCLAAAKTQDEARACGSVTCP
jgi:hypothetical protein